MMSLDRLELLRLPSGSEWNVSPAIECFLSMPNTAKSSSAYISTYPEKSNHRHKI